jgi:23S rRNA (uracil1939-C5)-methyltransferase
MIARAGGLVLLVSGAIPGERALVRIERVGKGVGYASAVEIEEASADRRTPECDPLCGGALYAHIAYPRQLELKSLVIADAFTRIARLPIPSLVHVAPSPEEGYRMRARLHVRGRRFGFFREGTHDLCDARQTRMLLPATFDAIDRVVAAIHSIGLEAVASIELAENLDASQRAIHIDSTVPLDPRSLKPVAETEGLTGLSAQGVVHGDPHVVDTIAQGDRTIALRRHVLAFFQGNRYLLSDLVACVLKHLDIGRPVVDLYAGVGLFSVAAATLREAQVTAVEGDRHAAADLAANAVPTDGRVIPVHRPVEAFVAPAGGDSAFERQRGEATVIVDPPRTGMSRDALDGICRIGAPRIIFVSCDVATLARDARRLVDHGYSISHIEAFDLFPNTPHVETVAVFERQ